MESPRPESLLSAPRGSNWLNRRINRNDPGSVVQISLFFRSELAPPATELHPRDFQKTEKSPELAPPATEKTPRPWFRTQMALFCSGSLGTPSGRKKTSRFSKMEKNSKQKRNSEIFSGPQWIYQQKWENPGSRKTEEKIKNINNTLFGHFREDLGSEDLGS